MSKPASHYTRLYDQRHPERRRARRMVGEAVASGRLVRPARCSRCGLLQRVEADHEDYSKPLDVQWLCHGCHMAAHVEKRWPDTRPALATPEAAAYIRISARTFATLAQRDGLSPDEIRGRRHFYRPASLDRFLRMLAERQEAGAR